MLKSLLSPETFFSEETLLTPDGLLQPEGLQLNNQLLAEEFTWLDEIFRKRAEEDDTTFFIDPSGTPPCDPSRGPLAHLAHRLQLSTAEKIFLLLALEPHYMPATVVNRFNGNAENSKKLLSAAGYFRDPFSSRLYPTLHTVLYLCAGNDAGKWRACEQELIHHGKLIGEQIITMHDPDERGLIGNRLNFVISVAPEYVSYLLQGKKPRPDFGRGFPAKWITTNLAWDQLVLNRLTLAEISDVMDWVKYRSDVLGRAQNKINRSFPVLFFGPPGTGKSFAAKLIGKEYGKDVFRIDLSMIVSKYIGETEKNLAHLFDRAEGKDWILFFDEADALFGKRTGISDSKDKWANLEMSYLLQRMEEYEGLCILATNLKHNLDPAMTRRFQALIHFPWPKADERMLIWEKSLPPGFEYAAGISLEKLSKFDMSGANIANVIKSACVKAAKRGDYVLNASDISRFIRIEFAKENRTA